MEDQEELTQPTQKAQRECSEFLSYFLQIGWTKSQLDMLETFWWQGHDFTGKRKPIEKKKDPHVAENMAMRVALHYIHEMAKKDPAFIAFEAVAASAMAGREIADPRDVKIKQLRAALSDMFSGWRYIRETHGDLYGVGWERCEKLASEALAGTNIHNVIPDEIEQNDQSFRLTQGIQ